MLHVRTVKWHHILATYELDFHSNIPINMHTKWKLLSHLMFGKVSWHITTNFVWVWVVLTNEFRVYILLTSWFVLYKHMPPLADMWPHLQKSLLAGLYIKVLCYTSHFNFIVDIHSLSDACMTTLRSYFWHLTVNGQRSHLHVHL